MRWTTAKPKVRGYYWAMIEKGALPEIVCVDSYVPGEGCDDGTGLCVWRTSGPTSLRLGDFKLYGDEQLFPPVETA